MDLNENVDTHSLFNDFYKVSWVNKDSNLKLLDYNLNVLQSLRHYAFNSKDLDFISFEDTLKKMTKKIQHENSYIFFLHICPFCRKKPDLNNL